MALLRFNNVGMTAIAACVPPKIYDNRNLKDIIPEEEVEKLIKSIGIEERRFTEDDVTSSDLCYKAAKKLMEDNNIDPESIDMLLFVSLTADYVVPPTSSVLQHKLGLPQSCACLDISLACSGFIYALSTAFAFVSNSGVNRVLVGVGETIHFMVMQVQHVWLRKATLASLIFYFHQMEQVRNLLSFLTADIDMC